MGFIYHSAIIVTSWDKATLLQAHSIAQAIFGTLASSIVDSHINEYSSFFIGPDGSKEGWIDSDLGDRMRNEFVGKLKAFAYSDGSSPVAWLEVQYGDAPARIVRGSDT